MCGICVVAKLLTAVRLHSSFPADLCCDSLHRLHNDSIRDEAGYSSLECNESEREWKHAGVIVEEQHVSPEVDDSFTTVELDASHLDALRARGPDCHGTSTLRPSKGACLRLDATVLSLRGLEVCQQPVWRDGSCLLWNGEVFGGLTVGDGACDSNAVASALDSSTGSLNDIRDVLGSIKGPWACAWWDTKAKVLWFGRDVLGRRSLVMYTHQSGGIASVVVSSVVPLSSTHEWKSAGRWVELPPALYALRFSDEDAELRMHEWNLPIRRSPILPSASWSTSLLAVLERSVRQRLYCNKQSSIAVLFSGGVDCCVIAGLAARIAPAGMVIELVNVAFGPAASDRAAALDGAHELSCAYSQVRWKLICVDVTEEDARNAVPTVEYLCFPKSEVLDVSLALALWFAARGWGYLCQPRQTEITEERLKDGAGSWDYKPGPKRGGGELCSAGGSCVRKAAGRCVAQMCRRCCLRQQADSGLPCRAHYIRGSERASRAADAARVAAVEHALFENTVSSTECIASRVMMSGLGADEMLGGYRRHRNAAKLFGVEELQRVMETELGRLWSRNLGRDDRVLSHHGREVRHPFLDEDVVAFCRSIPPEANLSGAGLAEKQVLRDVACELGLARAAARPKRAMQFGSLSARAHKS